MSIDFPALASASTQLRKRFRSGRRSWWSPSARLRSSAQRCLAKNCWSSFHLPLRSFDLWLRPLEALVPLFGVNLGVANLPRWTRSKPDVDKPFSCQQTNSLALSVDVSLVEHFELHVYTKKHLSKIRNNVFYTCFHLVHLEAHLLYTLYTSCLGQHELRVSLNSPAESAAAVVSRSLSKRSQSTAWHYWRTKTAVLLVFIRKKPH